MENWRKFRDSDELINEAGRLTPNAVLISPKFKPQGTLSRIKNKFTNKGDRYIDKSGKNLLRVGHSGHEFQFVGVYNIEGKEVSEPLGPPEDYSHVYQGPISSEQDIKKLWEKIVEHGGRFMDLVIEKTKELRKRHGANNVKPMYFYAEPNELIGRSLAYNIYDNSKMEDSIIADKLAKPRG